MSGGTWRDKFRPIIAALLDAHAGDDAATLQRALRDAWPAREPRMHWPYRIWRDEIARQVAARGIAGVTRRKKPIPSSRWLKGRAVRSMSRELARDWMEKRQGRLF
jgi:hypothetical protein